MDYPELKLKSWNLISLCNACHNKAHMRGGNPVHPVDGLTDVGERIKDRKKIQYENWLNSNKDNKNNNKK
jgi:5-methylcytosine-specific restriction endonuclease McrA